MKNQFLNRAQRMHAEIRKALLEEWDPIGVKDIPEAKNEYDGYVPKIYKMLIQRKTTEEIFDYLWWVENEYMGLTGNRQATMAFAERLMSLAAE
jgi:hypothetical protein